jgi:hypothetical protein
VRYYQNKFHRKPSSNKILEITSSFIQAREYFVNAERSNYSVKPLLLYYSISSLSRGLILLSSHEKTESSLKPAHGLEVTNWRECLKEKKFEELIIKFNNGTFLDLIEATHNKSYLRHGSSAVNRFVKFDLPEKNSLISFFNVLSCFPDLENEFISWTEKKIVKCFLDEISFDDKVNRYRVVTNTKLTENELNILFPKGYTRITSNNDTIALFTNDNRLPYILQKWDGGFGEQIGIGDICIIAENENSIQLNTISLYFIASYVLGMLSRYFPSNWISIARAEKGDSIYPLTIKLIQLIMTNYPVLVYDYLKAPYKFEN